MFLGAQIVWFLCIFSLPCKSCILSWTVLHVSFLFCVSDWLFCGATCFSPCHGCQFPAAREGAASVALLCPAALLPSPRALLLPRCQPPPLGSWWKHCTLTDSHSWASVLEVLTRLSFLWKQGAWNPLSYIVSVNNLRRLVTDSLRIPFRGRDALLQGLRAAAGRDSRLESLRPSAVAAQHWLPQFENTQWVYFLCCLPVLEISLTSRYWHHFIR